MQETKGILYCYTFTPSNVTGTVRIEEVSRGKLHRHVSMTGLTRDQLLVAPDAPRGPALTPAPAARASSRSRQRPTPEAGAKGPGAPSSSSSSPSRRRRSVEATNADYWDLMPEFDLEPDLLIDSVPEVLPAGASDHELELDGGAPYEVPHENSSSSSSSSRSSSHRPTRTSSRASSRASCSTTPTPRS